jgi:predicted helicase
MVDLLESQAFEKDLKTLNKFYSDTDERIARLFVSGIDNSAARQKLIVDLYDNFFKIAFPDVVERLGIVYTPIEVVDFINNSVAEILQREFNRNISDENICFLDPFAGTGTFLTRLIQSGLLKDSLQRKYNNEMFCNEIVLLAYYIASINIENAYHEAMGENTEYQPFNGICLTDTFQLYEDEGTGLKIDALLKKNSDRVELQKNTPIMCIIGNPPYSAHQKSANDNAQNLSYPKLDNKISQTYATLSEATSKTSLYDSYIKSFRWATDRLNQNPNGGIIAFVSNAGWLDGNAMDGMRKCLVKDFSSIYVFNLRGNQRTSGELSRKEGGKIFGSGSRAPIAITFLVKNPDKTEHGQIFYYDIGDYLTREDKLSKIDNYKNIYSPDMIWETIIPNDAGDWLNQRSNLFSTFIQLGSKNNINLHTKTLFEPKYSLGLNTNRDSWCYNFSQISLIKNIKSAIQFFNDQSDNYSKINQTSLTPNIDDFIILDPTVFSWDRGRKNDLKNGKKYTYDVNSIVPSLYRPYQKQNCYFNRELNNYVALMPSLFPTQNHINLLICVSGVGVTKEFTTIITNILPDLELIGKSQCFPLYYYEKDNQTKNNILLPDKNYVEGYTRHDGITDFILNECQTKYDDNTRSINKKHIFYYVYGILHSQIYRETFSSDLKKMLPRIPLVDGLKDFIAFSNAGKKLADIHLNYESVEPYSKVNITGEEIGNFTVEKMRFGKDKVRKDDKSIIYYNDYITIKNIPLDAYKYIVNGKSAIEWIMERYQVTTHKESLIKNDPNDWAKEVENPRYIVDLLLRIITVSMETMKIVDSLPKLSFETTK